MSSEVLLKKIEEAYMELGNTIDKVNMLTSIIETVKVTTKEILDRYISTIDPAKLTEMRESGKKVLQQMIEDISKIDQALSSYSIVEHQLNEQVTSFSSRLQSLEQMLQGTRKSISDIDTKLLKLIKEAEKNQLTAQKRFQQASQLFNASLEVEKYEELISLQKDNNAMLKELLKNPHQIKPFDKAQQRDFQMPKVVTEKKDKQSVK
jgi:chromosome segregation ATPase